MKTPLPHIVAVRGVFMTETYALTLNGDQVGTVILETQGLYYRFLCRCRLPEKQRVSLFADQENLGILVPDDGYFCLATKMPRKRFSEDNITFRLVQKDAAEDSVLIPVSADTPFPDLDRLGEASFTVQPDGPAIRIPVR